MDDFTLYESEEGQECSQATKVWENQNAMGIPQAINYQAVTDKKIKDTQSTGVLHRTSTFVTDTEYADRDISYKQSWIMDQYLCLRATTRGNVQQNARIRIEVCGDEVVTLADENQQI